MCVARRGLDLGVTEQFPDHGQTLSQRQGSGREGMAQVMKPQAEAVFASLWPRRNAPSTSLRPLYRPRCSRLCAPLSRAPSPAPDARSAPWSRSARGEGMTQIVEPHVIESRALPDDPPGVVQVSHMLSPDLARNDPWIARNPGDVRRHFRRLGRERHAPRTGLRIGEPHLARGEGRTARRPSSCRAIRCS